MHSFAHDPIKQRRDSMQKERLALQEEDNPQACKSAVLRADIDNFSFYV
jgi:hypothetical protein